MTVQKLSMLFLNYMKSTHIKRNKYASIELICIFIIRYEPLQRSGQSSRRPRFPLGRFSNMCKVGGNISLVN